MQTIIEKGTAIMLRLVTVIGAVWASTHWPAQTITVILCSILFNMIKEK
jgi:hypothetical protein